MLWYMNTETMFQEIHEFGAKVLEKLRDSIRLHLLLIETDIVVVKIMENYIYCCT